ncbi:MAG: DUF1127 domain-containing protein [Alphaproteobacteria bacterium]|nr:MAG: DUF1127 domain-containing protein [Alphaproteobacteria bacterium]
MANIQTVHTHLAGLSAADRLAARLRRGVATLVAWNNARLTRRALSRLSDRELDDIGLSRGDIDAFVERNLREF